MNFSGVRFHAVLFDLDGTLIDSFALITEAFRFAVRTVLKREASDEEVLTRWGEPLRIRLGSIADAGQIPALSDAYAAAYQEHHHRLAAPFPGVQRMLERVRGFGCRLAVVTSKRRRSTYHDLEAFGLDRYFDAVVTSEDVTLYKPAPDPVAEALRRLGAAHAGTLMVGDAVFDILAGKAAGVHTAAALWGARERVAVLDAGPDHVAERPEDVVALVSG